jgi:hypothetical protein
MRLAVLRLADLETLYAKEPTSPVVMAIRPTPPLCDAQITRLVAATPWNPVMIEADVDLSTWQENSAFRAEIQTVESAPKIKHTHHKRRVPPQALLRQFRGFVSHD